MFNFKEVNRVSLSVAQDRLLARLMKYRYTDTVSVMRSEESMRRLAARAEPLVSRGDKAPSFPHLFRTYEVKQHEVRTADS